MPDISVTSPQAEAPKVLAAAEAMQMQHTEEKDQQRFSIQCRLSVGAPDDPMEREADDMADRVMRMPEPAFIQRKCAHCEEEEKARLKPLASFIQKKGNDSGTRAGASVSGKINASRGNGSTMTTPVKSFMESRFGADFSGVKIHTGSDAVQMSRELNAQAFTVGGDIYFNEGKYNPQSDSGKHLLAHELTHTLQQSGGNNQVSRVPDPEFQITGLEDSRAGSTDFVFFELNKPGNQATPETDLDADERDKIGTFAAAHPGGIQLFGFASEEGGEADNLALIQLRMQAVSNVLTAAPLNYTDPIQAQAMASASHNRFNYRFWRAVEMRPLGGTSSRAISPAAAANRGQEACSTANNNNIVIPARDLAVTNLSTAITALDAFISNPAANAGTGTALQDVFHSRTQHTATQLKTRLEANRTFLAGMMSILQCGTSQSVDCGDAAEALTNPTSVTLCLGFFNTNRTVDMRAETLIHESAHGSRFELNDRAYFNERVMDILNTRQALDNAESLSVFVRTIVSGAAVDVGPANPDTTSNCGIHEQMVRAAVAWAERWNTYAVFGLQQTYGDTNNTRFMAPHINFHFGGSGKTLLAGILDKYIQMMSFFEGGPIDIECVDRTDPLYMTWKIARWNDRTVRISVDQLSRSYMNDDDRVKYIYGALATDIFGVPEEHRMAYPNVARAYKLFFWGAWG